MGCPFSPAVGMDTEIFLYIAVKVLAVNRADGRRVGPWGWPGMNNFQNRNKE